MNTLFLYTSDLCPKGVQARDFLTSRGIPFQEINLDLPQHYDRRETVGFLFAKLVERPEASLALPVLTEVGNAEEIVLLGFSMPVWTEYFSQQKSIAAPANSAVAAQGGADVG